MAIYIGIAAISLIVGIVAIKAENDLFFREKNHTHGVTTWKVNVSTVRSDLYLYQDVDNFL